ncbi:MAG: hypothetical protein KDB63_07470 [Nocardioidaceae bacterium]|nr:hypothetical protein [Nocardioidaceae bacterium]
MTSFEPFLGKATLTRLNDDEARCRRVLAVALGVKPWDVQVKSTPDGGYEVGLPRTYVKHDTKLDENAFGLWTTTFGQPVVLPQPHVPARMPSTGELFIRDRPRRKL